MDLDKIVPGQKYIAVYKGRKYELLEIKETDKGFRAHLQWYKNPSKHFWVGLSWVRILAPSYPSKAEREARLRLKTSGEMLRAAGR